MGWDGQGSHVPRGPDATEAQRAFAILCEYGHWPYEVPLFSLPAALGEEILELMEMCQSRQTFLLQRLIETAGRR